MTHCSPKPYSSRLGQFHLTIVVTSSKIVLEKKKIWEKKFLFLSYFLVWILYNCISKHYIYPVLNFSVGNIPLWKVASSSLLSKVCNRFASSVKVDRTQSDLSGSYLILILWQWYFRYTLTHSVLLLPRNSKSLFAYA